MDCQTDWETSEHFTIYQMKLGNAPPTGLVEGQGEYWSEANVNTYNADEELNTGIEKLIEHKRPRAAIYCLSRRLHKKQPTGPSLCVRALISVLSSAEQPYFDEGFFIVEIIKFLQESSEISSDDIFQIEWIYLSLLDRFHDATPKSLEKRLADDPEFFCYVIGLLYRSNKTDAEQDKPSKDSETLANKAWQLLNEWRIPPGTTDEGDFDGDKFKNWVRRVKEISTESGHLEVALTHIGQVLIHCPEDTDGLWINRAVAEELNAQDAEIMREGYEIAWFNSRGPYHTDPTGNQERELADKFRQKADDVEDAGFWRLAACLKNLAKRYDQ